MSENFQQSKDESAPERAPDQPTALQSENAKLRGAIESFVTAYCFNRLWIKVQCPGSTFRQMDDAYDQARAALQSSPQSCPSFAAMKAALENILVSGSERDMNLAYDALQPAEKPVEDKAPYLNRSKLMVARDWNPAFDQNANCECGHPYERHFDSYDEMADVGCKYCPCHTFVAEKPVEQEAR